MVIPGSQRAKVASRHFNALGEVDRFPDGAVPSLKGERQQIEFHQNVLAELSLHVCFKRTPAGLKLQQTFDSALAAVDLKKVEVAYFQQLENDEKAKAR